jgi:hypothetical protein
MYFATNGGTPDGGGPLAGTDVWLVTATNANTTYSWWKRGDNSGKQMAFGHTWAQLGTTAGGGAFIVDPWAGIACAKADFSTKLKAKLDRWHSQNKRINVNWGQGVNEVAFWTNANDDSILSLLEPNRTLTAVRGDGVIAVGGPPA